jgi:PAS domain S-box-containing protein
MVVERAGAGVGEAPVRSRSSELVVTIVTSLVVGGAYYLTARLSLRLALIEQNVTPLWPPTGLALVAMLRSRRRSWPGVALAAFLVNAPITPSVLAAVATAAGNTAAPLLAATLLGRARFRPEMDRVLDVLMLVGLAALVSMTVSATVGAGTLVISEAIDGDRFLPAWSVWWAGDAMGVLIVAPFLWLLLRLRPRGLRWADVELLALIVGLALVEVLVMQARVSMLFLIPPLVGWVAWRFQQRGAAPAALVASLIATWAAVHDRGPFTGQSLLGTMLTLQAFNAAAAFTAFFLAALESERMRGRRAVERLAAQLETRVRHRTWELSAANDRLAVEIGERKAAEDLLRRRERQLSEAQEVAGLGSWEWDLATGQITWSDEMYRIHGYEHDDRPVTFDRAIELVPAEDQARIRHQVEAAIRDRRRVLPAIDYRIDRADGERRILHGNARLTFGPDGSPARMNGTVQDVTERREYEREHHIAETLQRALLPQDLPTVDGFELAARYVPAEVGLSAGGDWYDAIPLADGSLALVIGDVSGHDIEAAGLMGQLRLAVRAYATEGHPPVKTVTLVDTLIRRFGGDKAATMLYVVVDPVTLELRMVNAGHPPPLVITADGPATFLQPASSPPLGWAGRRSRREESARLIADAVLVLYTDGLIDRRDLTIDAGLERLRQVGEAAREQSPDGVLNSMLGALVSDVVADDVAMVAVRPVPVMPDRLELRVEARPDRLITVRRSLSRWLAAVGVDGEQREDLLLACGEACTNAVRHAYGPIDGMMEVEAEIANGRIELTVRDFGRWSDRVSRGGRGFALMESAMDTVIVEKGDGGTQVWMCKDLSSKKAE